MTSRNQQSLFTQSMELGLAVPAVMAHRLTRMALAGPDPSARDRKEFALMESEKFAAGAQSLQAMSVEMIRVNQAFTMALVRMCFLPTLWGKPAAEALGRQLERGATDVLAKGLAPVHRKAVANARRLSRTSIL